MAYDATCPFLAHVVGAARNGLEAAANLQAAKIELTSEERQWLEDGDR